MKNKNVTLSGSSLHDEYLPRIFKISAVHLSACSAIHLMCVNASVPLMM